MYCSLRKHIVYCILHIAYMRILSEKISKPKHFSSVKTIHCIALFTWDCIRSMPVLGEYLMLLAGCVRVTFPIKPREAEVLLVGRPTLFAGDYVS